MGCCGRSSPKRPAIKRAKMPRAVSKEEVDQLQKNKQTEASGGINLTGECVAFLNRG